MRVLQQDMKTGRWVLWSSAITARCVVIIESRWEVLRASVTEYKVYTVMVLRRKMAGVEVDCSCGKPAEKVINNGHMTLG